VNPVQPVLAILAGATADIGLPHLLQLLIALTAGGGIGSLISARVAARRNSLDELRGIIEEQRRYIESLEARIDSLSERLRAQECEIALLRSQAPGVA
jgi:hypothetical protein